MRKVSWYEAGRLDTDGDAQTSDRLPTAPSGYVHPKGYFCMSTMLGQTSRVSPAGMMQATARFVAEGYIPHEELSSDGICHRRRIEMMKKIIQPYDMDAAIGCCVTLHQSFDVPNVAIWNWPGGGEIAPRILLPCLISQKVLLIMAQDTA